MTVDLDKVLAHSYEQSGSWTWKDVVLYHLGVGAGSQPTDRGELAYTYEAHLQVLPSFAVVTLGGGLEPLLSIPGLEFDPRLVLHAEQEIVLHQPLPTTASVRAHSRVADVFDKGTAAILALASAASDESGNPIFATKSSVFIRGIGGFGGERGPKAVDLTPDRQPDAVVESPTLPNQALLYRLNGDDNPLHIDPEVATAAGFPRPILHGLCTYGVVCKAIVDHALAGEVAQVARYSARFAGVVYPGETIVTSLWRTGKTVYARATTKERGEPVLTHTILEVHD
jgi:acyl dehydratase